MEKKEKTIKQKSLWQEIWKNKAIYLIMLPGIIWFIVFSYGPMSGLQLAFKTYSMKQGIWGSPWCGLENFQYVFRDPAFLKSVGTTLWINAGRLIFQFPIPIILALLMNELRMKRYKKIVQTVLTFPQFLSWVIVASIAINVLSYDGLLNSLILSFGGETVNFTGNAKLFQPLLYIDDWFSSSCYLIEGQDKALLIDTGLGEGNLAELVTSLTNLPVEVAITHPHGDHMHWVDSFDRVYLHKDDIALMREKSDVFPATFRYPNNSHTEFIPIEEGTKIHLGDIDVEVWELSGHTAHSVVFVDRSHKCIFTGDAIGSGYIVLLICSEEHAMETVEQYRESLMKITPRMSELKNFAWLGGHGIQENGCDPRHQQDYLAGESQYFNPIRQQVMLDMICLCNNLISGKISWKSVMDSPEHYCNTGSAGIFFRFI